MKRPTLDKVNQHIMLAGLALCVVGGIAGVLGFGGFGLLDAVMPVLSVTGFVVGIVAAMIQLHRLHKRVLYWIGRTIVAEQILREHQEGVFDPDAMREVSRIHLEHYKRNPPP